MVEDVPFYAWSILEAWNWLVSVPYLGFGLLAILGLFVLGFVMILVDLLEG